MEDKKLVILDYSGTLSVEAPDFGHPENLARALEQSGLARLGIAKNEIFWEKIIYPTWDEGSRTGIGYAKIMADRIAALRLTPSAGKDEASYQTILTASNRFVSMYFDHSRIHSIWRPLLEKLNADENVIVVIATDHYAEATKTIVGYLKDWHIAATPLARHSKRSPFIIVNSADMGFWKAERRFWEILKEKLPYHFRSVALVDDFGFNEADANGYGKLSLVRERRSRTKALLRDVFQTDVTTVSFFLKKDEKQRENYISRKIRETVRRIATTLRISPENAPPPQPSPLKGAG